MTESLIQCPNPIILLQSLENIAKKTKNDKEPHLAFYKFGSRNVLFKLEALYRIYRSIEDEDLFNDLLSKSKEVEDQLGQYDFHLWIYNEISLNKNIPKEVIEHFKKNVSIAEDSLKKFLETSGWLISTSENYQADISKLREFKWPSIEVFTTKLNKFLIKQVSKIIHDFDDNEYNLDEIEVGIHELRRKIRWISIYASSVEGVIQLKSSNNSTASFQKYLQPDVVNNPYNKLPAKLKDSRIIYIKSIYFYALSWIIEELGKLKDEGLFKYHIINELKGSNNISADHKQLTLDELEINEDYSKVISNIAKEICNDFFKKNLILQHILADLEITTLDS
jgi:hypothetical protein